MPYLDPEDKRLFHQRHYRANKAKYAASARRYVNRQLAMNEAAFRARKQQTSARYRKRHPERVLSSTTLANRRKVAELREFFRNLKNRPCCDCDGNFPYCVMEFDHTRGKKLFSIGAQTAARYAFRIVLEEVEKCDIVCANCHRIRTCKRRQQGGTHCPVHHKP